MVRIPARYSWGALKRIKNDAQQLERYHQGLRKLSEQPGLIGLIFTKPQSKINDPAKLRLLIQMMDSTEWSKLDVDVKGEVYEGLLARNADDVRGGAGQYFTPRPVIRAIIEVMKPTLRMRISDPACGTGGFLLAAFEYLKAQTSGREEEAFLKERVLSGIDLVPNVARLCAMNLFLHGIGTDNNHPVIAIGDSLESRAKPVDMVLTNPPFGKKSSFTVVGPDGRDQPGRITYQRPDLWVTTSNKQLNFVQHVYSMLREGGRAAIVVPDNVLFEGGAGERIRRTLLKMCDVHTLLRLPTGIWYSPAVKANVLFFDRRVGARSVATRGVWVYDLRSSRKYSLRQNPITSDDLRDFVRSYRPNDRRQRRETSVFRYFEYDDIVGRDRASLDVQWLQDTGAGVAATEQSADKLMKDILEDLQEAAREFSLARGKNRR